jgi:hypothetical protein
MESARTATPTDILPGVRFALPATPFTTSRTGSPRRRRANVAIAACLVAAVASWLRGAKYVHSDGDGDDD